MLRIVCLAALLSLFSAHTQATKLNDGQFQKWSAENNFTCLDSAKNNSAKGMTPDDAPVICTCVDEKIDVWLRGTEFDNPDDPNVVDLAKYSAKVANATFECLQIVGTGKTQKQVTSQCVKMHADLVKADSDPSFAAKYAQEVCTCTGKLYGEIYDQQVILAQTGDGEKKKQANKWFMQALEKCSKQFTEKSE